jgi:hypothetical protein
VDVKDTVQALGLANVALGWVGDSLLGQAVEADAVG